MQEICEPIFESVKPPGFKKIGFKKLQFGDAPIRIESVRMNRVRREGVFLELDFRWAGDPDIQLAIDTFGACVPIPWLSLAQPACMSLKEPLISVYSHIDRG
jgi:hypothetical protein